MSTKNSLEKSEWAAAWAALLLFVMVLGATCINRYQIRTKILIVKKSALLVISPHISLNPRGIRIILVN